MLRGGRAVQNAGLPDGGAGAARGGGGGGLDGGGFTTLGSPAPGGGGGGGAVATEVGAARTAYFAEDAIMLYFVQVGLAIFSSQCPCGSEDPCGSESCYALCPSHGVDHGAQPIAVLHARLCG
jgi:hypothetical protein